MRPNNQFYTKSLVGMCVAVAFCLIFSTSAVYAAKTASKKKTVSLTSKVEDKIERQQPQISQATVDALAVGDLSTALLSMREERDSPKLFYLAHQASRLLNYQMNKKIEKAEAHKTYQNIGIAYHNLYLFLKTKGIDQSTYRKEAQKFYKKARKASTPFHKVECNLLEASLLAATGEHTKAEKIYSKIDEQSLRGDFESMEYLAAYHAAQGNVSEVLAALDTAYRLNPDATLTWLAIGDDFHSIADDPQFQALLVTWKAQEASKRLNLSLPKSGKPRLQVTDEGASFHPQQMMPHYNIKKHRREAAKKSAAKSKKGTLKKEKTPTATTKKVMKKGKDKSKPKKKTKRK